MVAQTSAQTSETLSNSFQPWNIYKLGLGIGKATVYKPQRLQGVEKLNMCKELSEVRDSEEQG